MFEIPINKMTRKVMKGDLTPSVTADWFKVNGYLSLWIFAEKTKIRDKIGII